MGIPVPTTCHNFDINYSYEYQCPGCENVWKSHKPKKEYTTTRGCGSCRVTLVQIKPKPRTTKKLLENGSYQVVPMPLTPYQLFQKEMFPKVQAEMPPGTPFSVK